MRSGQDQNPGMIGDARGAYLTWLGLRLAFRLVLGPTIQCCGDRTPDSVCCVGEIAIQSTEIKTVARFMILGSSVKMPPIGGIGTSRDQSGPANSSTWHHRACREWWQIRLPPTPPNLTTYPAKPHHLPPITPPPAQPGWQSPAPDFPWPGHQIRSPSG